MITDDLLQAEKLCDEHQVFTFPLGEYSEMIRVKYIGTVTTWKESRLLFESEDRLQFYLSVEDFIQLFKTHF